MSKQTTADENGVLLISGGKPGKKRPKCRCKPRRKHKRPHRSHRSGHRSDHRTGTGAAPVVPDTRTPAGGGLGGLESIGPLGGLEGGLDWGPESGLGGLGGFGGPGPEPGGDPRSRSGSAPHRSHRSRRTSPGSVATYGRKRR